MIRLIPVACALSLVLLLPAAAAAQPSEALRFTPERAGFDELVGMLGAEAVGPLQVKLRETKNVSGLGEALSALRSAAVRDWLLALLAEPGTVDTNLRVRIRQEAIEGLWPYAGDERVAQAVAALLDDRERSLVEPAAEWLRRAAHPATAEVIMAFDEKRGAPNDRVSNDLGRALVRLDTPAVTAYLKKKLQPGRAYMPWFGIIALEAARQHRVALLPELLAAAERVADHNNSCDDDLIQALGVMGDRSAVPVLRRIVEKRDFRFRYWAAFSLGLLGDRAALPSLRAALPKVVDYPASPLYVNRSVIAWALATLGEADGTRLLLEQEKSADPVASLYARMFLLRLQGPPAARRLMAQIRPYADAAGCPRVPAEQLVDAFLSRPEPEVFAWLREAAGWKQGCGLDYPLRRAFEDMPAERRRAMHLKALATGDWAARSRALRALLAEVSDPFPSLVEVLRTGDLPARVLAARALGASDRKRFEKPLRAALTDPAWQVSDEARTWLTLDPEKGLSVGLPATPGLPPAEILGYEPEREAPAGRAPASTQGGCGSHRLLEQGDGQLLALAHGGGIRYDGMQWQRLTEAEGLCPGAQHDAALLDGALALAGDGGLSLPRDGRWRCVPSATPLTRVAVWGKTPVVGSAHGVLGLQGQKLAPLGGPKRPVHALASTGGALWVAVRPAETDGLDFAPLWRLEKGRWSPVGEPFVHYQGELRSGIGREQGRVELNGLAADRKDRLLLATSWGVLRLSGSRVENLSRAGGNRPWHSVESVAVGAGDRVLAGFCGYFEMLDGGRWRRLDFRGQPILIAHANRDDAVCAALEAANGELWFGMARIFNLPPRADGQMVAGSVLRRVVDDARRRALPPDTLVSAVAAGVFRKENGSTDMRLPNRARPFESGEPVRMPGNVVAVSAAAKDPWDYSGVQFRFRMDEGDWGEWSDGNTLLTPNILDEGVHRVLAQSRDADGHVDPSPAEVRFTVYTKEITVIKVRDGQFERIFPSQLLRYQTSGVGRVLLENTQSKPIEVQLELKIEDLFEQPARVTVQLAAGEQRWVPVPAPFSERILANDGQRTVQAVVEARFSWEDVERSTRQSFPLELLEAGAFDWQEPERLASFINGRDPLVEQFCAGVYQAFAARHPEQSRTSSPLRNFLLAQYAYEALSALGLKYKPDAARPFASLKPGMLDAVQFPGQTLERKTGDCDDLTVLLASVLENLSIPTAVVPVEGHVFALLDTGVRLENRTAFPVEPAKLVERTGHLWLPLETTVLGGSGGSFEKAWARGAEVWKNKGRPDRVLVVADAWSQSPPATRPVSGVRLALPALDGAESAVGRVLAAYGRQVESLSGTGEDHQALVRRGAVLAKSGLFEQAAAAFEAASRQRDSYEAAYGLASAWAGRGDMLQSLVAFQKALSKASSGEQRFRCQLAIAQCYKVNGNLAKARGHLAEALKLNPAARYDAATAPLVKFLEDPAETKAASEDEPPPFFQEILSGM